MIEALDRHGLLKLISPALAGEKLNLAGLNKLEKTAHSVLPNPVTGGWLAFLSVLLEKLNAEEQADALRAFDLEPGRTRPVEKARGADRQTGGGPKIRPHHPALARLAGTGRGQHG